MAIWQMSVQFWDLGHILEPLLPPLWNEVGALEWQDLHQQSTHSLPIPFVVYLGRHHCLVDGLDCLMP